MDYAQYVSRRPPSPPLSHTKFRSFSVTPSMSTVLPAVPFATIDATTDNTATPVTSLSFIQSDLNNNNTLPAPSPLPTHHSTFQSPSIETSTTTAVSTYLHRRAVRDEYTALAAIVKAAVESDYQYDRQETVRIRLELMLSKADPRTFRVLTIALQRCNASLDALASTTRSADEARARMRVIESKHFHGARASVVPPELRALHIRRGALATLVDHILCTLHDQVRIHFLLTQLASNLSGLRTLLVSLDRDRSSPVERFDRNDDVNTVPAPPSTPNASIRSPTFSNVHVPHRMDSLDTRISANSRASFCADTSRQTNYSRRVSHSYALRHFSQDGVLSTMDRPPSPSPSHTTNNSYSTQPRSVRNDLFNSRPHTPLRDDSPKLIQQAVKRALSYNSNQQNAPERPADEASWWGDTPPPSATAVATAPPSSKPNEPRQHSRISFVGMQSRLRGESKIKTARPKNSGSLARAVDALPWRRRGARVNEDPEPESGEDDALPVSPVSQSTGSDCHSSRQSSRPGSGSSPGTTSEQSVLLDIDTLCTEACSVLTSSQHEVGKVRRRGSLSSGHWVNGNNQPPVKHIGWLGFGRLRAHGQMKKLWTEINELYSIVVTHGPHLVEEKIVPRSSLETGLLGSWNAGKGQGSSLRVTFQTGVVVEAMRKVESIVGWQRRLVVAIRRDLCEQRRALRQLDRLISQAYLASLDDEKG